MDFLQVGPRSWDLKSDHGKSAIDTESSTRYLTAIISNPLIWLDDEQREIIWDLAVRRVAERSGSKGNVTLLMHDTPTVRRVVKLNK